jgi:hypothetical protein
MTMITVKGSPPPGSNRCVRPGSHCGNHCCNTGSTCVSGICCPIGSTRVGDKCCPKGYHVIGNICCAPSDSCGKVCCGGDPLAPGLNPKYICANPELSLCCLAGRVNCNGTCCGGSCVHGECIETLAECKAQGFDSNCSTQKPCPIKSRCVAGCCSQSI